MAYTPHSLVAFGGALTSSIGGDEIWECTVRGFAGVPTAAPSGLPLSNPEQYLSEVGPKLRTWFSSASAGIPAEVTLNYLKMNTIGADGRYSDPESHTYDFTPPQAGGYGSAVGRPAFLSIALSWGTLRARGPASRGRIYLPNYSKATFAGSVISGGDAQSVRQSGLTLLDTLANNGSEEAQFQPCVVSKISGLYSPIKSVRVGNVYDVQRRRKNALAETYVSAAWPV